MAFNFTPSLLRRLRKEPRLLGYLIGFNDLKPIHDKWIIETWTSIGHHAIQCHRGSLKTSSITIVGCVWYLLFHPSCRIALIRETWNVATDTLWAIKRALRNPAVAAIFRYAHGIEPKAVIDRSDSVVFNFKTQGTIEGNIDAYGIDTVSTGMHYDKILCDDIITFKDRYSAAKRDKTIANMMEIITNIIDPGKQCMFVGTPWHKDDGWKYLKDFGLPIHTYAAHEVGILTDEDLMEKRKTTTHSLWMANYFLVHTSDEDLLFQNAQYAPWELGNRFVYAHIDAKYRGEDTLVLTIISRRKDGRIQVRGWVYDAHVKEKIQHFKNLCRRYGVRKGYSENNNDQNEYLHEKMRERDGQLAGIPWEAYHEGTNKHQKIVSYLSEFWSSIVFADDCDERYINQICDYVEGEEPDDAPDSLASILREKFFSDVKRKDSTILHTI